MRSASTWERLVAVLAAVGVAVSLASRAQAQMIDLDQGWNPTTSNAFWFGSQGSRIMTYSWFIGLEQADSTSLLSDVDFLEQLGFIGVPGKKLPIGFAADTNQSRTATYVGLTCAACHTGRLNLAGRPVLVEGGPSMVDFTGFLNAVVASTSSTLSDDAKFARFAARVNVPPTGYKQLREELKTLEGALTRRRDQNAPVERYGFGRVDAFGHIFNRVFSTAIDAPDNDAKADAPVSYPFLWDTPNPMHERVQWNWSAPNAGLGDVARNVGELLGVFGEFDLAKKPAAGPYYPKSSVDVKKLVRLERMLTTLRSPVWPSGLSQEMKIDPEAAARGKTVYESNCQRCHALIDRAAANRKAHDKLVPLETIGTDSRMTENHARRLSSDLKTGLLRGRAKGLNPFVLFGEQASGEDILKHVIAGVIAGQAFHEDRAPRTSEGTPPPPPPPPPDLSAPQIGYKARSLNGIWATAPYLHNGSVPTLANLLSKDRGRGFWISNSRYDQVKKEFYPASNTFDPTNVGIAATQSESAFWFDTTKEGNTNTGHPFGTNLDDGQKKSLIEFLKTL